MSVLLFTVSMFWDGVREGFVGGLFGDLIVNNMSFIAIKLNILTINMHHLLQSQKYVLIPYSNDTA